MPEMTDAEWLREVSTTLGDDCCNRDEMGCGERRMRGIADRLERSSDTPVRAGSETDPEQPDPLNDASPDYAQEVKQVCPHHSNPKNPFPPCICHALTHLAQRVARDAKADGLCDAAEYVYKCGTASHPSGYGDWCGGEVDPIKLLVGVSEVLARKAADRRSLAPQEPTP